PSQTVWAIRAGYGDTARTFRTKDALWNPCMRPCREKLHVFRRYPYPDGSSPPSLGRFPRISLSNHWYYRAARGGERLPTFCLSSSQLAKGSPTRSRSPLAAYLGSASAPPPSPGHGR